MHPLARWAAVIAVLGSVACGAPLPPAELDPAPRVEVAPVRAPSGGEVRRVVSTLEPRRDAFLTPLRGGRVVAVERSVGDAVARGDVLIRLDDREARANLALARAGVAEAEAALADAERQLTRVEALGDGASAAQVDAARAGRDRAQAARDRARAQADLAAVALDETRIKAPFDGTVLLVEPEVGEAVGGQGFVARVADLSSGTVTVGLVEDEVRALRSGAAPRIQVASGAVSVPATVRTLAQAADPRSRSWPAELDVAAHDGLPLGSAVEVVLEIPVEALAGEGVVAVPAEALRGDRVFVIDGEVAHARAVSLVGERGGEAWVTGVAVGAEVVVYGPVDLRDGDAVVRLAPPPASARAEDGP